MFARSVNLRLKPNGVAGLPKTCLLICCDTSQSRCVNQHDGDGRWTKALSEENGNRE
jgi:hypothetical protein